MMNTVIAVIVACDQCSQVNQKYWKHQDLDHFEGGFFTVEIFLSHLLRAKMDLL